MLSWLKNTLLAKYVNENNGIRNKKVSSLKQAKSIGIVTTIADEESYRSVFSIFSTLQRENRTVKLVAYIDEKEVPFFCLKQLTADYFCRKDLNWYGKPAMVQVKDFMETEFDLLLDFSPHSYPAVRVILQLSKAGFKIGANPKHDSCYDLYITGANGEYQTLFKHMDTYSHKLTGEAL